MRKKSLTQLAKHFGSMAKLAEAAGATRTLAYQWKRDKAIPLHWAKNIVDASDGAFVIHDLPVTDFVARIMKRARIHRTRGYQHFAIAEELMKSIGVTAEQDEGKM